MDSVLTIDDVMTRYQIQARETAGRLFKSKGFGGYKIGHRWYVREKDLLRYEDQNKLYKN